MLMQKKRININVSYFEFIGLVKEINNYVFKNNTLLITADKNLTKTQKVNTIW